MEAITTKFINLKANLNNVTTMLNGTDFSPVPLSQVPSILMTSANPNAYAIIDNSLKSIIPGLIVFLSFGDTEICKAKCWKTMDDTTDHESVYITTFSEKENLVNFISDKANQFAEYMKAMLPSEVLT